MNWMPSFGEVMVLLFVVALGLYLRELTGVSKIRGVLRAAFRRADNYGPGGRETVRIDRNQVAELLGEEPDPNRGRTFQGKFDPVHPNMRSHVRRAKLRR